MRLQCFPPTRYVMGGASRVHIRDNLYQICSKVEYGEPACTVWLYNAVYLYYGFSGQFFFLLSVSARLKKKKKRFVAYSYNIIVLLILNFIYQKVCCRSGIILRIVLVHAPIHWQWLRGSVILLSQLPDKTISCGDRFLFGVFLIIKISQYWFFLSDKKCSMLCQQARIKRWH